MAEHADDRWTTPDTSSWLGQAASPDEDDRTDAPLRFREYGSPLAGLRASGSVDMRTHLDWEWALRDFTSRRPEVYLDLADLEFIDVRGVSVLVDVASGATGGQQVLVGHPPRCLQRIMEVLWPNGAAAITFKGEQ
ncbi:STAS domain-containing protein [Glycomyces tarimensis]